MQFYGRVCSKGRDNMINNDNQALKKIDSFFRTALGYYGKEVGLTSNQLFSIDQICDPEKEKSGEYSYTIQYGFPQSGAVMMNFGYSQKTSEFTVDKISVYAPPVGENIMMANFAPQLQAGPVGINVNFGMDMGTQEHTGIHEIEKNPNALKMLDIAIADLSRAQILGDCMVAVPAGSDRIPCCNSTRISNTKGKLGK